MKKILTALLFISLHLTITAQTETIASYKKTTAMIPMRDGVKLFTVILSPVNATKPILFLYNALHMVPIFLLKKTRSFL